MTDIFRRLYTSRFLRFSFVGGLGFFVNEAALAGAHGLMQAGPRLSWLIAFVPSVTFTWWGNRRLTFADRSSLGLAGALSEWGRFVAANSVGALANFLTYEALIDFAPAPFNVPYAALMVGVVIGLLFNFTLSKHMVFRKTKKPAEGSAGSFSKRDAL